MKPRIPFHFHLITLFIVIFTIVFILASCNPSEPEDNKQLTLTVEDASSTEVWVGLKTNSFSLPVSGMIKINSLAKKAVTISSSDTVIYIDSLSPNTAYKLQAELSGISSSEVTVTTMDTTSHNFTWQTYTFGGVNGSSVLNDVAIINENDIWAVGEIHTKDTDQWNADSTEWVQPYNAVHWNGNSWELKRIIVNFRGNSTFIPLEGIFAFSSNDIWVVGSLPIHGDGNNWRIYDVREITNSNLSLSKAWGTSSNNMYFVGRGGSIAHYNGSPTADGWEKIESGTELDIQDIWGISDSKGGYNKYLAADNAMLKINKNNELTRINVRPGMYIISIWGESDRLLYTAGGGVDLYKNQEWEEIERTDVKTIYRIRGESYSEVFGISSTGSILHYNGNSWYAINTPSNNVLLKLDVGNNLIAAIGWQGEKAVITIIKRN